MIFVSEISGLGELGKKLDGMQQAIAGPIARSALAKGGEILRAQAEVNVHKLTGALAADIIVKVSVFKDNLDSYALIGPGWDPGNFRRVTVVSRHAGNREVVPDQTTNPGIYGYFLEVGHRAPGQGLAHNQEYQRAARISRKTGKLLNTYTKPSSREYGHLSTPPYPWLAPAAEQKGADALTAVGEEIRVGLIVYFSGVGIAA